MHCNFAQLLIYRRVRKRLHQFVNGLRNNIGIENDVTARRRTEHATLPALIILTARRNTKHVTVTSLICFYQLLERDMWVWLLTLVADDVRVTMAWMQD